MRFYFVTYHLINPSRKEGDVPGIKTAVIQLVMVWSTRAISKLPKSSFIRSTWKRFCSVGRN